MSESESTASSDHGRDLMNYKDEINNTEEVDYDCFGPNDMKLQPDECSVAQVESTNSAVGVASVAV